MRTKKTPDFTPGGRYEGVEVKQCPERSDYRLVNRPHHPVPGLPVGSDRLGITSTVGRTWISTPRGIPIHFVWQLLRFFACKLDNRDNQAQHEQK